MRKALRIAAGLVAAVVVVAIVVALAAQWQSERKRNRVIDIKVAPVAYASDPAVLARGKYLYDTRGCMECHGRNGGGAEVINDPDGMYVKAPNISPGPGSVVKDYGEVDWVRSIRHGVSPQRRPLLIMPSKDYNRMTDADLAALVAYVRSLPPAAGEGAVIRFPFIVKALYAFGVVQDDAAKIDHTQQPPEPVPEAVTTEHGLYVAQMCRGCHGDGLSGGKIAGAPPAWPPASNLTPGAGSAMTRYDSAEKLKAMLRSGKRPDGSAVSPVMPFVSLRNLSDTDVGALYVYLKGLPPRAAGEH